MILNTNLWMAGWFLPKEVFKHRDQAPWGLIQGASMTAVFWGLRQSSSNAQTQGPHGNSFGPQAAGIRGHHPPPLTSGILSCHLHKSPVPSFHAQFGPCLLMSPLLVPYFVIIPRALERNFASQGFGVTFPLTPNLQEDCRCLRNPVGEKE